VTFIERLFGGKRSRRQIEPLYRAVVAAGRDKSWYARGGVPDTIDGRFDMIAAVLALVMLRLEANGEASRDSTVLLAETFVDDMEGSLREIGIGDLVVGKHVGRMMSALGGRLGALREALGNPDELREVVRRNIFHEKPLSEAAVDWVTERLAAFHTRLQAQGIADLLAGDLPPL